MLCCLAVQLQGFIIGVTTKDPGSGPVPRGWGDITTSEWGDIDYSTGVFTLGVITLMAVQHVTKGNTEICIGSWTTQQATHLVVMCQGQESFISTTMGGMWVWPGRGYPQTNHCGGLWRLVIGDWSFQKVRLCGVMCVM